MLDEFRYAFRRLRKARGFALTAILSLALAIGAGTAAFSVIDAVRFRALPFRNGDRLVVLAEVPADPKTPNRTSAATCGAGCDVAYTTFANLLEHYPFQSVDLVAAYTSGAKALNLGGEPILVTGGVASDRLFSLLGAEPFKGRVFTPEDNRLGTNLTTVLSYDLWKNQLGGSPDIIGQVIKLSDSRYTVIGIMPPGFKHEVGSQFWMPSVPTLDPSTRPSIRSVTVVARLKAGATVEQFRGELGAIDPQVLNAARPKDQAPVILDAAPLRERYAAATQSHDLIFAAVVACILLIAGANLANLVLVRALHQTRELAVRAALGAGQGRLTAQMLAEQTLIVAVAAVLGLGFAAWLLGVLADVAVLQSLRPAGMEYRVDGRAIGFAIVLAAGFSVLLGLVPARFARRRDLQTVLRQSGSQLAGGMGAGAQRVFVVAQIALAVVLATGAGLMARTVMHLSRVDLGFDAARLVEGSPSFPHPWRVREKFIPVTEQIARELALLPGVQGVGIRADAPLGPRGAPPKLTLDGQADPLPPAMVPVSGFAVDTGYFRTVGVAVARGRDFSGQDLEAGQPAAIVNEWAARHWWPGKDPIGQVVQVDTAPGLPLRLEVVGVVRDNKAAQGNLLLATEGPELYRPLAQAPSAFPTFLVRAAGAPSGLVSPVKRLLARLVPDRPVFAQPTSDKVSQQLGGIRTNAWQILGFAVVGLLLAVIGIHGVLSYAVSRRTREIGIRGALGAGGGAIRAMVLKDTAVLALVGLGIGVPVATVATRSLAGLLHGVEPGDPTVLVVIAAVMLGVALVAGWFPARRAARVDPLVALRDD